MFRQELISGRCKEAPYQHAHRGEASGRGCRGSITELRRSLRLLSIPLFELFVFATPSDTPSIV
jgi:hypothetical protein